MTVRILLFLVSGLVTSVVQAQVVRHVPTSAFPTIQSAIDASQSGDVVRVAPGSYAENLDLTGKDILVHGVQGPSVTSLTGPGNLVVASETTASPPTGQTELCGFTLTGTGLAQSPCEFHGANIKVSYCRFLNNQPVALAGGNPQPGAIGVIDSILVMEHCQIIRNRGSDSLPDGTAAAAGGLRSVHSDIQLIDCRFENNSSGAGASGGAAFLTGSLTGSTHTLENCYFKSNHPGGALGQSGQVGGVLIVSADAHLEACEFVQNGTGSIFITIGNQPEGTAALEIRNGNLAVNRCVFGGNVGTLGGCIGARYSGNLEISNSVFLRNYAVSFFAFGMPFSFGDCIAIAGQVYARVTGCLFSDNGQSPGNVVTTYGPQSGGLPFVEFANSIVTNIQPSAAFSKRNIPGPYSESFDIHHCCVNTGVLTAGPVILSGDPQLEDPSILDFRLKRNSPCRDAGDPNSVVGSLDFHGDPRVVGANVDIGPDEFFGLEANCAEGNIPATSLGLGTDPYPVIKIDGLTGGDTHVIHRRVGESLTFSIEPIPDNATVRNYVIFGTLGLPSINAVYTSPILSTNMCFAPAFADPTNPSLFVFSSSIGPGYVPADPMGIVVPSPPFLEPITFTIQGVMDDDAGVLRVTNAIAAVIR